MIVGAGTQGGGIRIVRKREVAGWTDETPSGLDLSGTSDHFGFSGHPVVDPSNAAILYAGCDKEGLFRSTDYGRTWAKRNTTTALDGGKLWFLTIDSRGYLYAGQGNNVTDAWNERVIRSTDGGVTFSAISADLNFEPYGCDVDPADDDHLIFTSHADSDGNIYESEDGGVTIARTINTAAGHSGYAYFGQTAATILHTSDGDTNGGSGTRRFTWNGSAWSAGTQVSNRRHYHGSHRMWVDRTNGVIYNPHPAGVDRSTDDGETWTQVSSLDGAASCIVAGGYAYAGKSYALGSGTFGPAIQRAALPATSEWSLQADPSGMGIGPRAMCTTTNEAGQTVIIACCWVEGLWRLVI